jgi:hypothetical protein
MEAGPIMDELTRFWEDLAGRVTGPMSFRLLLQPAAAVILAVRAGLQDARAGRPPYTWSIFADPAHRRDLLREGWKAIAKVFIMAVLIDVVYQLRVLRWVYPVEAALVALLLACVPYLLIRGPVDRLMRRRRPAAGSHT